MTKSNIFGSVRTPRVASNAFNLSHERKFSMNMGHLTPILCQEVLPGDRFRVNSEIFRRLSPMIAPMMHRVNCFTHFFFVPNRIIWDEWESFITGGEDGTEAPVHPYLRFTDTYKSFIDKGTLCDYMGLPVADQVQALANTMDASALPFRAYAEIFNEYYRDQNLQAKLAYTKTSGQVAYSEFPDLLTLQNRAWEKDYYTSCLPWSQRGGEVNLPITSSFSPQYKLPNTYDPSAPLGTGKHAIEVDGDTNFISANDDQGAIENLEDPQTIDTTTVTINDLRKSARLQEYLEIMARGGSRYIEQMKALFGVRSSDARLQRPEYLGGGKTPVVISEVLSTVGDSELQDFPPQGNMSGHGISVGKSNSFKKRFEEHGHIIGIMSVLPRTAYQNTLNRSWKRFDRFDHYIPQFAHIGEQEVLNEEVWQAFQGTNDNAETFGYQSRYAEYKYKESTVHGDFRDNLDYWHMGRKFATRPNLNENFVKSDPTQRVFAVTDPDEHKLYVQLFNSVKAVRPMPYHSQPTL